MVDNKDLMTGYERRRYDNLPKSAGDILKNKEMVKAATMNALGLMIEETLPSGEIVEVSVVQDLVNQRIAYERANPKEIDLLKWQKLMGEAVERKEVSVRTPDELFGDIVMEAEISGEEEC